MPAKRPSQRELDKAWMREYYALRRSLFPDEATPDRGPRVVHDPTDGRVQCGGGSFRRLLTSGAEG